MWVMLITFFFFANPGNLASNASISTAEFSSEATCEAARDHIAYNNQQDHRRD